jgi:hypothetical protein
MNLGNGKGFSGFWGIAERSESRTVDKLIDRDEPGANPVYAAAWRVLRQL